MPNIVLEKKFLNKFYLHKLINQGGYINLGSWSIQLVPIPNGDIVGVNLIYRSHDDPPIKNTFKPKKKKNVMPKESKMSGEEFL